MIKINKDTKIYVMCPSRIATGGPELLHQLVHKLNKFGFSAQMFYTNKFNKFEFNAQMLYSNKYGKPINPNYIKYDNNFSFSLEDQEQNILVVPETMTGLLYKYKKVRKIIWWLSVDNFSRELSFKKIKLLTFLGMYKIYNFNSAQKIYHIVQSEYARSFIEDKGVQGSYYLSDYLNIDFLNNRPPNYTSEGRKNNVLYNPAKGFEFTKKIISKASHLNWIPLINLSPVQVSTILKDSKVYIDFGNHPGKDRFPREAAISGCCVITGKRGSAKFQKDLPIKEEYKFNDDIIEIDAIISKIEKCINNYDDAINDFSEYREVILKDENKFEKEILQIFIK
ncbi:MAG: hypothetical protein V4549_14865 [Bacteroidota bacterium]